MASNSPSLAIRRRGSPGQLPGTLNTDPNAPRTTLSVLAYGADGHAEPQAPEVLGGLDDLLARWPVVWVNVVGLGDPDSLCALGERLGLHALAMEDVVNVHQRAKVEEYAGTQFVVMRAVALEAGVLTTEQVSMFLREGLVVTFQEREGDCLDPLRQRIRKGQGRIRTAGADYLAYAIADTLVDHYFPVLDEYADRLAELEEGVIGDAPAKDTQVIAHQIKRDLAGLRRSLSPVREVVGRLARDVALVSPETRLYFRDCYDHCHQALETIEACRDATSSLMDLNMSVVAQRTNETMRVLTIIATIFIPLGFIAGLYGMNFDTSASPLNMPELSSPWGYPAVLLVMVLVAGGLLAFFQKRGWLSNS